MRKDVAFNTEDGITIRAWHYVPEERRGKVPTIVMAHGFSAVKEMYLDCFADAFAAAGLASIVFDNRNFGASDGSPRQEVDPWQQVHDYRDAITYAETLKETDPERIGIWGTSYSGGHVLVVGAVDRRVKCVVSQVPLVSGPDNAADSSGRIISPRSGRFSMTTGAPAWQGDCRYGSGGSRGSSNTLRAADVG